MPGPIAVNVGTQPSQLWSGRSAPGINTLLLINTDVVNTVMVGTDLTSIVVPILPNGSLSVDPTSNWYVVGIVVGLAPLVVVPNGQSQFLGISQGYGNIAIPQFQSPNFDAATGQGWALYQNGTASFNEVTIVISSNGVALLIYFPVPGFGNLVGSWAASATTDQYGNTVPAGINVNGGVLNQVALNAPSIVSAVIEQTLLDASQITNSNVIGGTSYEQTITFDTGGGMVLGYSSTTTTVTKTANGTYTQTLPAGVTSINNAYCWGAGGGGNGGDTSFGGPSGGGGEFAGEATYTPSQNPFSYTVGAGGNSNSTGNGNGGDGGNSFIDIGVNAHGGQGNGTGGSGSTNTIHFNGGNGAPSNSETGAASGGNSGNPTGAGNNGISPTGSGGAASPAAQSNSGTGGAGGSSGANGTGGGSPGAGGGGAGKGTATQGTLTKSYNPRKVLSYYGPDATNGNPNGIRGNNNTLWQGGETASGGAANGNQRGTIHFSNTMQSDFAGYTMTEAVLHMVNQHTWFGGGSMNVECDVGTTFLNSDPTSWPGFTSFVANGTVAEGDTTNFGLGNVVAGHLVDGTTNFLAIGGAVYGNNPYNVNWYGYFNGNPTSMTVTLTGTKSVSGSFTSGAGSDGKVSFSYTTAQTLVFGLSPVAGTDANSNAFAAGYTGPVVAIQPGSSPAVLETWHNCSMQNGWGAQGGAAACRYKLLANGQVLVQVHANDSSATSGTMFTLPTGYVNATSQFCVIGKFVSTANTASQIWICQISNGAFTILEWTTPTGGTDQFIGEILLDLL